MKAKDNNPYHIEIGNDPLLRDLFQGVLNLQEIQDGLIEETDDLYYQSEYDEDQEDPEGDQQDDETTKDLLSEFK